MTSISLPAYAKVNLFLDVLGRRPDGYHELVTLFERLDLADQLTLKPIPGNRIEFVCDHPEVPLDGSNLVVQAVQAYRRKAQWEQGIRIELVKRIPVAGGLGGGSSDAAATLMALKILSGGLLPKEDLLVIAKGLGADVSFFLAQTPWALGTGRGDEIQPLDFRARLWHLLVFPRVPIPTKSVYQAFRGTQCLTAPRGDVTLLVAALRDNDVRKVCDLIFNALEPTAEALFPVLRQVKEIMRQRGGFVRPLVSGSGSTVLAVCSSRAEAEAKARSITQEQRGWQILIAATGI